jgi:hypothetical protein
MRFEGFIHHGPGHEAKVRKRRPESGQALDCLAIINVRYRTLPACGHMEHIKRTKTGPDQ